MVPRTVTTMQHSILRPAAGRVLRSALARWARRAAPLVVAAALWSGAADDAGAAPSRAPGGIRFTYEDTFAQQVSWAGAFNGWNATAHPMTRGADGVWSVVVDLPAGAQEYKFVVDGQWVADPENAATSGEFGNSVIQIGADGGLVSVAATSNTAYSPKILVGGRIIGLYQSIRSTGRDRFELRRPDMDIDLNFAIRVSEVLRARFLTNIRSETEDVEFFRSRLNFDRGFLEFTQPRLRIFGYDNEDAGTTDDPLHLVGDIGIYHHGYGFGRQGFRLNTSAVGVSAELHYADNFEPGSEFFPGFALDDALILSLAQDLPVVESSPGVHTLAPGGLARQSLTDHSDRNEDMTAARLKFRPLPGLDAGLLGRADRGFNLGTMAVSRTTGPDRLRTVFGTFEQQWRALGADARWRPTERWGLEAEYLRGVHQLRVVNGLFFDLRTTSVGAGGATGVTEEAEGGASGDRFDLDVSNRVLIAGDWTAAHGDIGLRAGVEFQDHAYALELDGVENRLITWRFGWDRNWRYYLNREVRTSLDVEAHDFDYDPRTPWNRQFWFAPAGAADPTSLSSGNFWLEHDEHVASFDRITLLGGQNMVSLRPAVHVPLMARRNLTFDYEGVINVVELDRLPKYAETNLRLGVDVTPFLRLSTDTRWAKYDDPLLGLFRGYVDHFAQLAYAFAPGIRMELSYGVDPVVLDAPVNEFARIGRDQFLFDPGRSAASPATALTDYYSLGQRIAAAEKAMRDERRVQVRGIVNF